MSTSQHNRRDFFRTCGGASAASLLTTQSVLPKVFAGDWSPASTRERPSLLLDAEEIETIRKNIKTKPWAQKLYDQLRRQVDETMSDGHRKLRSDYAWFYGEEFLYQPLIPDYIWAKHTWKLEMWEVGKRLRDVGLVSAIAGGIPEYAQKIRDFIFWTRSARQPKEIERYILFIHHMGGANMLWAYDLVHNLISEEDRQKLEPFFHEWAHHSLEHYPRWVRRWHPNIHLWVATFNGLVGYFLDDKELIKHCNSEFERIMSLTAQGRESIVYEFKYNSTCAMIVAEAARHYDGTDYWNWTTPNGFGIGKMYEDYQKLTFSDFSVASWGDYSTSSKWVDKETLNSTGMIGEQYIVNDDDGRDWNKLGMAALRLKSPELAWFELQNPHRDGWDHAFWGYTSLHHGPPTEEELGQKIIAPPAPSNILPERKVVMLRSEQSSNYWRSNFPAVCLRLGGFMNHGHCDTLHITLHGAGTLLEPDWFMAGSYFALLWNCLTPGHNTVRVNNGRNTRLFTPVQSHEFGEHAQMVRAEGEGFPGTQQGRTLVLTKEYLFDAFANKSEDIRTYDWMTRSFGERTFPDHNLEEFDVAEAIGYPGQVDKDLGDHPKNRWILGGCHTVTDEPIRAQWIQKDGRGLQIEMLGEEGTELMGANAHYVLSAYDAGAPLEGGIERDPEKGFVNVPPPEDIDDWRIPLLIARRKAKATTYFTVHRPIESGTETPLLKFEKVSEKDSVSLFRIQGDDYTDYIAYSSSVGDCQVDIPKHGTKEFSKGYFYLRVKGETVAEQGA